MSKFDDDLLNLRKYPRMMYMDIYGNGTKAWDHNKNCEDIVFKAPYLRLDLAIEEATEAAKKSFELGMEKNNATPEHELLRALAQTLIRDIEHGCCHTDQLQESESFKRLKEALVVAVLNPPEFPDS